MKFMLDINVVGNAKAALAEISSKLMGVNVLTGQMESSTGGLQGAWKGVSGAVGATHQAVGAFADKIDQMAAKMVDGVGGAAKQVFEDAATFQDLGSNLSFAFGDRAPEYFAAAEREASKLTFSMKDVVDTITSLSKQKVDIFGSDLNNIKTYESKTGAQITALEVFQDAADAAGRSADRMLFSFREAFSGDWVSMKDALDLSKKDVEEFKKAMAKGTTETEKADILLAKIAGRWGGAGALRADNFNKTIQQLPDLLQQINAQAGREGLKAITSGFKELVEAFTELKNNKAAMSAFTGFFHVIGAAVGALVRGAAALVRMAGAFLSLAPWMGPLAGGLVVVTIAVSAVGLSALTAAAAVMGLVAAVMALEAEVAIAGVAAFIVFSGVIVAATAVFAALGLVAYGVAQVITANFGGVADALGRVKLVFTAISELYESYNGTAATMSRETADKLKKGGLFETVTQLYMIGHRVAVFFRALGGEMSAFGARLAPTILPMLSEMKMLFFELAAALGISSDKLDLSKTSSKTFAEAAREVVTVLVEMTRHVITVIRVGVAIARLVLHFQMVQAAGWAVARMFEFMGPAILLVGAAIIAVGVALMAPFILLMGVLTQVIRLFRVIGMLKDGMSFKDAWSATEMKAPLFLADAPRQGMAFDPSKMVKAGEGDTSPWKEGDLRDGRRVTAEEANSLNSGKEIGRYEPGGKDYDAAYQEKVSQDNLAKVTGTPAGPPTADQAAAATAAAEQAAAAKQQAESAVATTGILGRLQEALSSFSVSVQIDGAEVAKAVNAAKEKF